MSSYLALLRHDHLDEVLHMFAYLKLHANSDMIYDPRGIEFDRSGFPIKDWSYSIYTQYGCELSENIMPNITKPLGKGMVIMVDVDSDHTGDTVTMISRKGFLSSSIMHQFIGSQRIKHGVRQACLVVGYVLLSKLLNILGGCATN